MTSEFDNDRCFTRDEIFQLFSDNFWYSAGSRVNLHTFLRDNVPYRIIHEEDVVFIENMTTRYRKMFYKFVNFRGDSLFRVDQNDRRQPQGNRRQLNRN